MQNYRTIKITNLSGTVMHMHVVADLSVKSAKISVTMEGTTKGVYTLKKEAFVKNFERQECRCYFGTIL